LNCCDVGNRNRTLPVTSVSQHQVKDHFASRCDEGNRNHTGTLPVTSMSQQHVSEHLASQVDVVNWNFATLVLVTGTVPVTSMVSTGKRF
jgi:hypothetical protein